MSNIVFSFDAQAFGVLAAIDAMIEGFGRLEGAVEGMVSSFGQINSQIETMQAGWSALFQNFDSLQSSLDNLQQGTAGATRSTRDLGYQLEQLAMQAQRAAEAHSEAVQRIQQEEADLTERTQEEIARRQQSYQQALDRMVEKHQYAMQEIQQQEDDLSANYLDQIDKRLVAMQNPQAVQHKYLTESLEQQIAALASLGQGNSAQAQGLENELTQENQRYQQFLQNTIQPYYQYIDAQGYRRHQEELQRLQDRLGQENSMYAQQTDDLKNNYQQQLADLQTHYKEEEAALERHLADENIHYAEQMQQIALERQHALAGGSGGGGGVGIDSSALSFPPTAGYIQLFRQLGIDPSKDPQAAQQALMAWMMGGSFRGQKFQGQYLQSQLTLPQLFQLLTGNLEQGQDPTRGLVGGRNYLAIMSDLVAYAGANRLNMSPAQIQNQIAYGMDQILAGNTGRGLLSLERLGLSKKYLEVAGLRFDKSGKVENPADAYMAVMKATELVAPGLGSKEAFGTVAGVMNEFRDIWNRIAIDIGQSGVWARFRADLTKVFFLIYDNIPAIEKFGEGIGNWVLGTFEKFFNFMQSSQGQAILHDIGNGFREIGNALQWMGQHKDIVMLLIGLLTAQAGSKILEGLTFRPLQSFMSGGLFGGIGGLFRPGAPSASAMDAFKTAMGDYTSLGNMTAKAGSHADFLENYALQLGLMGLGGNPTAKRMVPGAIRAADTARTRSDALESMFANMVEPTEPGASPSFFMRALGFMGNIPGFFKGIPGMASSGLSAVGGVASAGGSLIGQGIGAAKGIGANIFAAFGAGGGGAGGVFNVLKMGAGSILPMLSGLGPALAGIAAAAGPILLITALIGGLIFLLVQNRDKIMPFIMMLGHFLGDQLHKAITAIQQFIGEVKERLGPAFGPGSFIYNALQLFSKFWAGAWGGIKLAFSGVWDVIVGIIKVIWALVSGIILIGLDLLGGKWGQAWKDVQKTFVAVFQGIWQFIVGIFKIIGGVFIGFFGGIWGMVSGGLQSFWKNLVGFFAGIPAAIGNALSGIGKAVTNALIGIANFDKSVFDFLASHAGIFKPAVQGLAKMMHIPGYAEGGAYPGRQLALVGERGPELFFSGNKGSIVSNQQIRDAVGGGRGRQGHMTFYGSTFNLPGVTNPHQFYAELNRTAGKRAEHGIRGGNAS